jgi:hypothetical protein
MVINQDSILSFEKFLSQINKKTSMNGSQFGQSNVISTGIDGVSLILDRYNGTEMEDI